MTTQNFITLHREVVEALQGMLDLLEDSSELSRKLAIKDAHAALANAKAAQQDEDDGCPDCKVWMAQKDFLLKSHNLNGDLRIKAEEELAALKAAQPLTKEQVQPAQGEPAKLWCETCEGSGQVYEESQAGIPGSGGNRKCPDCSGDGYITSTVFRTALLQSNAERVPLTPAQRVDIADACANLDYDDNFLGDLGKIIDLVEAAHGITKGQQ